MKAAGGGAHHLRTLVRERGYTHMYERSFVKEVDRGRTLLRTGVRQ